MNEIIFIAMVGFLFGAITTGLYIVYLINKEKKELIFKAQTILDSLNEVVIPCKLDIVEDTIFMYRRDNDLFVSKARTLKELQVDLKKRFPDNYFDVNQEEIDEARVISILNERKENASSS